MKTTWLPDLVFNDFFNNNWLDKTRTDFNAPAVNIIENDNSYEIEVAAPGLTKDDLSVKVDKDDVLSISFEKKDESNEKDDKGHFLRREFSYSKFVKNFTIPENADKEKIDAKVENGILTISLAKKDEKAIKASEKVIDIK